MTEEELYTKCLEDDSHERLLGGFYRIHPGAIIAKDVRIGEGTVIEQGCHIGHNVMIGHYCVLRPDTNIGSSTKIGHLCVFEGSINIEAEVAIQSQCFIAEHTYISAKAYLGPKVMTLAVRKIRHTRRFPLKWDGVYISYGARIGAGSIILPGVTIRREALIGAGSVVTKDCDSYGIYIGSPAKKVGEVPEEERL